MPCSTDKKRALRVMGIMNFIWKYLLCLWCISYALSAWFYGFHVVYQTWEKMYYSKYNPENYSCASKDPKQKTQISPGLRTTKVPLVCVWPLHVPSRDWSSCFDIHHQETQRNVAMNSATHAKLQRYDFDLIYIRETHCVGWSSIQHTVMTDMRSTDEVVEAHGNHQHLTLRAAKDQERPTVRSSTLTGPGGSWLKFFT